MKTRLTKIALIILIMSVSIYAGEQNSETRYDDLPKGIYTTLVGSGFFDNYEVYFDMSPFFQRGDFNGDGEFDIAIQVINKTSRKRGIVFLHNNALDYTIIGAGQKFGNLGDDFNWLNKWRIDSYSLEQKGIYTKSEALILNNPDFPKSLVYFDGKHYQTQGLDAYSYYSDGPVLAELLPQL